MGSLDQDTSLCMNPRVLREAYTVRYPGKGGLGHQVHILSSATRIHEPLGIPTTNLVCCRVSSATSYEVILVKYKWWSPLYTRDYL